MADTISTPLFAVDTNFLLDLEDGEPRALAAFEAIRKKASGAALVAPPTVLDELANGIEIWPEPERSLALQVLLNLREKWKIHPVDLVPTGHGIVEIAADCILNAGLLPRKERNDAFIVSESALMKCALLVSSDNHLLGIDLSKLATLLTSKDLTPISIRSPRAIVGMFT